MNVVGNKWVFRLKRNAGSIQRHKARLVAKGFHQNPGIDFFETFSPIIKASTVRVVLNLAVSKGWNLQHLDFNNAFLNGELSEDVYMSQPAGYVHPHFPDYVCKLNKAIYGLKQAPRAWNTTLSTELLRLGFVNSRSDSSLFIFPTYVEDLLYKLQLTDLKPAPSPSVLGKHLSLGEGTPLADPLIYRSTIGVLQYLTNTRPDISYIVNHLSQFLQKPIDHHWQAVKRILRYISGTKNYGLLF
ncbi:hypothetical protein IC575_011224 [Cucumis melo]